MSLTISTNYGTAIVYIITNLGIVLMWTGLLYIFLNRIKYLAMWIMSIPSNGRNIIFDKKRK